MKETMRLVVEENVRIVFMEDLIEIYKITKMNPEIAIVESNILACIGLQILLEGIIPKATIRVFRSFSELTDDTPDMYAHYFVSSQVYFEHTAFFWNDAPKPSFCRTENHRPCLPECMH